MSEWFQDWGKWQKWECLSGENQVATFSCIPIMFLNIVSGLLIFAGLIALVMFLVGSFKFMNSAGDAKRVEGARNYFIYGTIGLAIVLSSFVIINIISIVTGVACIRQFGFGCGE